MKKKGKLRPGFSLAMFIAVALLGLWHVQDVRDGAVACGDLWLLKVYLVLAAAVLVSLFVLGRGFFGSICLERLYPCLLYTSRLSMRRRTGSFWTTVFFISGWT